MAEISRIPGPSGSQDSGKDKRIADAQKFKELMKPHKVGEVDEDQKKKRKRKDEAEAEAEADTEGAISAQPDKSTSKIAPFTSEGTEKVGGPMKAQPGAAPSAPKSMAPSNGPLSTPAEDESFMSTLPASAPREAGPALPKSPTTSAIPEPEAVESDSEVTEKRQLYKTREKEVEAKQKQAKTYKEVEKSLEQAATKEEAVSRKEKEQIKKIETVNRNEENNAFSQEVNREQRERQEEAGQVVGGSANAGAAIPGGKKTGKGDGKIEEIQGGTSPTSPEGLRPGGAGQTAETAPAAYTYLHPQVLDLFERMVGVVTVMSDAGITQTTVTLSNPEYAKSAFFGAQIIITEYASAQKSFNIQIVASPQGVALFHANVDDLVAAFQNGKYNFKINRIEASLAAEKPLFHRKEGAGRDEEGQGGRKR